MASQLIHDDHGIVLITPKKSLEAKTGGQASSVESLCAAMQARELVCVGTKGGGMVQTVVQTTGREEAEKTTRAISQFGWTVFPQAQLKLEQDDEVIVLPFSHYSQGCQSGDEYVCREGESWSTALEAGLYDVHFGHLLEAEDVATEGGVKADRSVWFLLVKTETPRELTYHGVPGI